MLLANPYAAPQTLQSASDVRKLPMATLASSGALRKELPAVSTRELARLVRQSRALDDMQLVWIWLTVIIPGLIFAMFWFLDFEGVGNFNPWPLIGVLGICLARLILGHGRSSFGRWYCLLLDASVLAASVVAMTWLAQRWFFGSFIQQVLLVLCTAFLFYPAMFGFQGLVALLEAGVLFGERRCRPRELVEEFSYRRELGIE